MHDPADGAVTYLRAQLNSLQTRPIAILSEAAVHVEGFLSRAVARAREAVDSGADLEMIAEIETIARLRLIDLRSAISALEYSPSLQGAQ